MNSAGTIIILAGALLLGTAATAQVSLTPPGLGPPPASRPPAKPAPKPPAKKPAAAPAPAPTPAPEAKPGMSILPNAIASQMPDDPNADLVYGAFQRGQYKTAFTAW